MENVTHSCPKYRVILNGLGEWVLQERVNGDGYGGRLYYWYEDKAHHTSRESAVAALEALKAALYKEKELAKGRRTIVEVVT